VVATTSEIQDKM